MRIERLFTAEQTDPFATIETSFITIEICHEEPSRRLCIPRFEVPSHWSRRACEHLAHHYVRRTGVPAATKTIEEDGVPGWLQRSVADEEALEALSESARFGSEQSYRQIMHRLVGAWTYWGWKNSYFDSEADARAFYDETAHLMIHQQAMPASPQWVNTGLFWAYGIAGDAQGCFYVDADSGELRRSENAYERPQHHHCFIQGVKDELSGEGGITDLWQREMRVFKHGSGSGCNMSQIRSSRESLSNGQRPAGIVPFLEISEKAAHTLAGMNERPDSANKLSLIDCDHPDLEPVIRWRLHQHRQDIASAIGTSKQRVFFQKIKAAIREFQGDDAQRFDPRHNAELAEVIQTLRARDVSDEIMQRYIQELQACEGDYPAIGEQLLYIPQTNENNASKIGFRLSDSFMRAAANQQPWYQRERNNPKQAHSLEAETLLDEVAYFNWLSGDGVVQYQDTVEFWNGCKAQEPIRASSPGGEFLFLDHSACDIAVINLRSYINAEGALDIPAFEHTVRLQTIMCDISISMAQFPSSDIAYNTYRYRPIGLSLTNLAAALVAMGYAYDSAEARATAAAVCALMTGTGYVTSSEIASELGGFEAFNEVRDSMMQMMWQHHEAAFGRTQHLGSADVCPMVLDHAALPDADLSEAVQRIWDQVMIQGDEHGYSNAQISLIAHSPNINVLMDALSPGVSPIKATGAPKALRDVMIEGLKRLDYKAEQIASIIGYMFGHRVHLGHFGIEESQLRALGFGDAELALIEEALQAGQSLHAAFDPLHLGERFCREALHLSDAQLYDADFKLLYHLGFHAETIEQCERQIEGHGTIIGAPFLRKEDYAIFAFADHSEESPITVESQIQMAAIIQPYLSGGVAMEIETPPDASMRSHRRWIMMAWQLGLKHLSLQRAEMTEINWDIPVLTHQNVALAKQQLPQKETPVPEIPSQEPLKRLAMLRSELIGMGQITPRSEPISLPNTEKTPKARELPARRHGYVQEAHIGGVWVQHRVEEYEDGSLARLHIDTPDLEVNLRQSIAQTVDILSIALQYGVPLEAFIESLAHRAIAPQGVVIGHDGITHAQSITDYLLQDLLPHYASDRQHVSLNAGCQVEEVSGTIKQARDLIQLEAHRDRVDNNPEAKKDKAAFDV